MVLAALLAGACAALPARVPESAAYDRHLEDLHARGILQGAVVFGHEGRVTYARGFGFANAAKGVPFTPSTPSDGASITKTFTAAAVLALASEGRLDLEAPVRRYLQEYPHEGTKVRHLISHTAGLPDYDWFDRFMPPPQVRGNADQLVLLARERQPPLFPPGTRFQYDNAAYDAAALLVERVSSRPFEAVLRERFFGPLSMTRAFIRPARLADFRGERTVGYRSAAADAATFDAFEGEAFHGGGNVYLSAMDLHGWAAAVANALPPVAPLVARGLQRASLDDERALSLTLLSWYRSADGRRHYYFGHHNGFYNFAYWDRTRRISIAFVSNSNVSATHATDLPRALIALAEGRTPTRAALPALADPSEAEIAGPWKVEGLGTLRVRIDGRRRYMVAPSGIEYPMYRFAPGLYAVPGYDAWMRFHREDGRAALLWDSVFLAAPGRRD